MAWGIENAGFSGGFWFVVVASRERAMQDENYSNDWSG
jgi:hypothetical protein